MYQPRTTGRDIGPAVMLIFRVGILGIFVLFVGRLFQLQVLRSAAWTERANENRYESFEQKPLRGIIYDKSGTILVRNRPSFEVALVPEFIPEDDEETPINEEREAIAAVLKLLDADQDPEIAVRIQELLFRRLGQQDYRAQLEDPEKTGLTVSVISVPDPSTSNSLPLEIQRAIPAALAQNPTLTGTLVISNVNVQLISIPDTSIPLPLEGLVVLVQRLIELRRQGSASVAEPILGLVDRLQASAVIEQSYRLKSMRINPDPVREYVYEELFSHVLGFMGPIPAGTYSRQNTDNVPYKPATGYRNPNERVGLSGLEYSYQNELRGIPGYRNAEVDILGREVRTLDARDPVPGNNLVLGIDLRLQRAMRNYLQAAMDEKSVKWGVTIAMNPQTGLILGLVSLPGFDNNIFAEGIGKEYFKLQDDERKPLINYAIGGLYPPGSTFKMVPATAALQEGIIGINDVVRDDGPLFLPNRFFPNDPTQGQVFVSWNHKLGINYGPLNVVQALALSNDIYFYWIGGGYPPSNIPGLQDTLMEKWAELFGYGTVTGIDLPGEVDGNIPDDQWKRQLYAESWTTGDSYNMSIGQGYVLATPLQVLVSTAAIANGGKVVEPQVVYQVTDAGGGLQKDFQPKIVRELPAEPKYIEAVKQGMLEAVQSGTAIAVQIPGLTIGAKTGTAEYCDYKPEEFPPPSDGCRRDKDDNLPTHAWFVAFAPYEDPEIAVVTFVYDGGEGSGTALPVTRNIFQTYFTDINPRPIGEAAPPQQ